MDNSEIRPVMVNLEDWEQSGEGWNALTYNHKTDADILLKLNRESIPCRDAEIEFGFSKAVHDLGVRCPATLQLVTDGKRYGIITERLPGKKSFTRILSECPEMLEPLAKDMAEAARVLHSIPCDTEKFESVPERIRREVNFQSWIKGRKKALLNRYADAMRPVTTCLHGDMHPGNYLRTEKGDYWIDMGRFGYGDPDTDYASQYILANLAPEPMIKNILHLDRATYSRFVDIYGQYYYGPDFRSAETQERLRRAVCLVLGHAMCKSPKACRIFGLYVTGHEKITFFVIRFISLLMKNR